jgi:hypothetical protein
LPTVIGAALVLAACGASGKVDTPETQTLATPDSAAAEAAFSGEWAKRAQAFDDASGSLLPLLHDPQTGNAAWAVQLTVAADTVMSTAKALRDLPPPSPRWAAWSAAQRLAMDQYIEATVLVKAGFAGGNLTTQAEALRSATEARRLLDAAMAALPEEARRLLDAARAAIAQTVVPTKTPTPKPTATPAPPTATPEPPGFSFGSGKKLVGSDIAYATYRTRSASSGCYWERLRGLGGTFGEIVANDNTNGPAVVTIMSGDAAFNSSRCARWTQDLSPITSDPNAPFPGEGTYIVGVDISPGLWKSDGLGSCYWQRLSNFSGSLLGAIIANDNADGPTIVRIGVADKGFSSSRCGTWTKAGP